MTLGVMAFALLKGSSKQSADFAITPMFIAGMVLVVLALVCDGIYGPYQNKICQQHSPTSYHLMFNMNLYEGIFAAIIAIGLGEFGTGMAFVGRHPEILPCKFMLLVKHSLRFTYQETNTCLPPSEMRDHPTSAIPNPQPSPISCPRWASATCSSTRCRRITAL